MERARAQADGEPAQLRDAIEVRAAGEAAQILKAMADPLRLRMLSYLLSRDGGEACVNELQRLAHVLQPTVSHHLKVLRDAGLVEYERRAPWVWYWIAPDRRDLVESVVAAFNA